MLKDNLAVCKKGAVCGHNEKRGKSEKEHLKAYGGRNYMKLLGFTISNCEGNNIIYLKKTTF